MDNKKILLVNLSKGKTGELNSQLLGMIFVMKFQAAAMGRANMPEDQRQDFSLYVDEFQNFATDSFETILSEARKYRLNLILANQFMTQLTDKVREAIIGNVGTVISGRIGTTDAELMAKKFIPTFTEEDLTKLPNFETIASVMIHNVPSAPFSMSLIPPLGHPNAQLADALKRLTAAKFGRSRANVEKEIFARLRKGDDAKEARRQALQPSVGPGVPVSAATQQNTGSSFLDEWLAKRKQITSSKPVGKQNAAQPVKLGDKPKPKAEAQKPRSVPQPKPVTFTGDTGPLANKGKKPDTKVHENATISPPPAPEAPKEEHGTLSIQRASTSLPEIEEEVENNLDEIFIDVRGNLHHRSELPSEGPDKPVDTKNGAQGTDKKE